MNIDHCTRTEKECQLYDECARPFATGEPVSPVPFGHECHRLYRKETAMDIREQMHEEMYDDFRERMG